MIFSYHKKFFFVQIVVRSDHQSILKGKISTIGHLSRIPLPRRWRCESSNLVIPCGGADRDMRRVLIEYPTVTCARGGERVPYFLAWLITLNYKVGALTPPTSRYGMSENYRGSACPLLSSIALQFVCSVLKVSRSYCTAKFLSVHDAYNSTPPAIILGFDIRIYS